MEDLSNFLIAMLVMAVALISSISKAKRKAMEQQASDEMDPTTVIDLSDEAEYSPVSFTDPQQPSPKEIQPTKETQSTPPTPAASSSNDSELAQRLHTPQGAREAFIYSQIFQRKYQ